MPNKLMLAAAIFVLVLFGLVLSILALKSGDAPVGRAGSAQIYRFDYEGRTYLIVKGLGSTAIIEHEGAADR